jgi:hypothetical protein
MTKVLSIIKLQFLVLIAFFAMGPQRAAAMATEPPHEVLRARTTDLWIGQYLGQADDGRLKFAVMQTLRGNPSAQTVLRVPVNLAALLSTEQKYLVASSRFVTDPRNAMAQVLDPDGPSMIVAPGLEPAIFVDSEKAKELTAEISNSRASSDAFHATARSRLLDSDTQIQNAYAAEMVSNQAYVDSLSADDAYALQAWMTKTTGSNSSRSLVLGLAWGKPERFDAKITTDAIKKILSEDAIPFLDREPPTAEVAMMALTVAQELKLQIGETTLARWVTCGSAALAEGALLLARRTQPELEKKLISNALAQSLLSTGTRTFLLDHLRRLNAMPAP